MRKSVSKLALTATLALAITFTLSCEEKSGGKALENKLPGIYEYAYPDASDENNYIVLTEKDGKITGLYYGTSDEFDEAREGYEPAFFVLPMNELEINGNSIKFVLNVSEKDYFSKPVDKKITSTQEAVKAGYESNKNPPIRTNKRQYAGNIQSDGTIFFKGEKEWDDRKFIRK